ncbi:hypothetical protein EV714DRAFT_221165 [Schizophyllum commune]
MPLASIAISTQALERVVRRLEFVLDQCTKLDTAKLTRCGLSCSPCEPNLAAWITKYNQAIEREADHLQILIAPLQDLLQRAKIQITRNSALLLAHQRLPQSILSKIFLVAAHEDLGRPAYVSHLYNFTRVCHRWRAVALNTPGLCTTFTLWDTETEKQYEIFAHELKLTGSLPLDVRLLQSESKNKFETIKAPTESWKLLRQQSKRWRSLTLEMNFKEFCVMMPSGEPLDCQSLEALYLNHNFLSPDSSYRNSKYDLPDLFLPMFYNATALRTVQIKVESVGGGWKQKVCFLETWRLTDLSLCFERCGDATRFLPILKQQAGTLQRLNFAITEKYNSEDGKLGTHATPISMHKLTELSCRLDATPLISCIKAPKLKSLTIDEHPGVLTDCIYNTAGTDDARVSNDATKTGDAATGREISNARIADTAFREIKDAADTAKSSEALPSVADRVKTYIHLTSLSISNVDWPTDSLLLVLHELILLTSLKLNESKKEHDRTLVTKTFVKNMMPGGCVLVAERMNDPTRRWFFLSGLKELHITLGYTLEEDQEMINLLRDMADSRSKDGLKACIRQYDDPQMKKTIDIWS